MYVHVHVWLGLHDLFVYRYKSLYNTMSPARARTHTARSGDECTNHEATAPPTMPLSTQEYKWVLVNCWGNLTNCWGVTCNGLASRPGGIEILLAASWYGNRDKLRPDEPVGSKGFTHINHYIPCNYVYCWGRNLFAEVQMQLEIKFLSLDCKKRNAAVEIW